MLSVAGGYYVYRRRFAQVEGGDQENLIPPQQQRPAMLLPTFGGRLRLCRRIPSPQLSHNGDEEPANL